MVGLPQERRARQILKRSKGEFRSPGPASRASRRPSPGGAPRFRCMFDSARGGYLTRADRVLVSRREQTAPAPRHLPSSPPPRATDPHFLLSFVRAREPSAVGAPNRCVVAILRQVGEQQHVGGSCLLPYHTSELPRGGKSDFRRMVTADPDAGISVYAPARHPGRRAPLATWRWPLLHSPVPPRLGACSA